MAEFIDDEVEVSDDAEVSDDEAEDRFEVRGIEPVSDAEIERAWAGGWGDEEEDDGQSASSSHAGSDIVDPPPRTAVPRAGSKRKKKEKETDHFRIQHREIALTYARSGTVSREDVLQKLKDVFGDKLEWAVISMEYHKQKPSDPEPAPHLHAAVYLNSRPNVRGKKRLDIIERLHPENKPRHPNIQKVRNMSRWLRYVCKRDRAPLCHQCDKDELHLLMASNLDRIAMMAWRGDEDWREIAREENPGMCCQYWKRLLEWEEEGIRWRMGKPKRGYVLITLRQKRDAQHRRLWHRRFPVINEHTKQQTLGPDGKLLWGYKTIVEDANFVRQPTDRAVREPGPYAGAPSHFIIPIGFKRTMKQPQPVIYAPPNHGKTTLTESLEDVGFRPFVMPKNNDFKGFQDGHFSYAVADEFKHTQMPIQLMNCWLDGSRSKWNIKGGGVEKRENITTFLLVNFEKDDIYPHEGDPLKVDEARAGFFKRIMYIDGRYYDLFDARYFDENWQELSPKRPPDAQYCEKCGTYPRWVEPVRLPVKRECNCEMIEKLGILY